MRRSKLTLGDGIGRATRQGVPIAARFELDERQRLLLSVVVAANALESEVENNAFRELSGPPADAWPSRARTLQDPPRVARAAQQALLMAMSPLTLAQIVKRAVERGPVMVAAPDLRQRRPVFVVIVVANGKPLELTYDLATGQLQGS